MNITAELNQIEEALASIRAKQKKPMPPVSNITASLSGNVITVEWQSNSNSLIDIEYYADGQPEWKHSVADYVSFVHSDEERYEIGVGDHTGWQVRLKSSEWVSDAVQVKESAPEPSEGLLVGIWDSWNAEELDLWKDYASRIDTSKKNLIVQVGNFKKGMSDRDIRNRIKWRLVDGDVLFYLLDDEPFLGSGSLSAEYWNHINDIASEFDIPFGWSLSDNKVTTLDFCSEHEMIVPINTYLFFQPEYGENVGRPWGGMRIETQAEFNAECDRVFNNARKKLPNSKFIFVAQGFYTSSKYRKPPVESINWTYEYVSKHSDIIGVLWYEHEGKDGYGLKDMPEFYEQI